MSISVLGAGAFGTSLAIALAHGGVPVTLWGRDARAIETMRRTRRSGDRLPGHDLPESLTLTSDLEKATAELCLLSVPTQELRAMLKALPTMPPRLVACCKGIDRNTGLGPVSTIENAFPSAGAAMLTGPSFAVDIVRGLPTALVVATRDEALGVQLQTTLTRPALRLYRTTDVTGAELGGAIKNVVALAAGMSIGAGLGDSARASIIARGFSEMTRYSKSKGAISETLHGLSGLGDLVLTCTSEKSRNFAAGIAIGKGIPHDTQTVEGLATARVVADDAVRIGLDLPIMASVADVVDGKLDISAAIATLLARPVGKE